jgi:hypothetical protein
VQCWSYIDMYADANCVLSRYALGQIPACIMADKVGGKTTLGFAILGNFNDDDDACW